MSDDRPSETDVMEGWLVAKGYEAEYKDGIGYFKFPIREYKNNFNSLIQSLLGAGYDADHIRGSFVVSRLQKLLVPPPHRTKGHRTETENWQNKIKEAWEYACAREFGQNKLKHVKEAVKQEPIAKPEENAPVWMPPKGKLDLKTFKGFETTNVPNEEFIKVLEELKNGK
jgi:hypothetical protein